MALVAVLDVGFSAGFEKHLGGTVLEYDFVDLDGETHSGQGSTHANHVAESALLVTPILTFIDFKVGDPTLGLLPHSAIEAALSRLLELVNQGWQIGAVNLSFGGDSYPNAYADELQDLANSGVVVVAASGNNGTIQNVESVVFPARLSSVISVGATDPTVGPGELADFTDARPGQIDLLAPGVNVPDEGYWGTSFAAPQVAATAAVIQERAWNELGGPLDPKEVLDLLQQGGVAPLSAPDPADGQRYYLHDHEEALRYFDAKLTETSVQGGGVLVDQLVGSYQPDLLLGNLGNDSLAGGLNHDTLRGGAGADLLQGNKGQDQLFGNGQDDFLQGGQGADLLRGGQGEDTLRGNLGDDSLYGDKGADLLVGGLGADHFILRPGDGQDSLLDFNGDEGDRLDLQGQEVLSETLVADGLLLEFGSEDSLFLHGITGLETDWFF